MSRPAESKTKQNKKTRDSHMSIYRMYIAFKNTISHYAWRKKSLPKLTVKSSRSTYRHARLYVDIYIYICILDVYFGFISFISASFNAAQNFRNGTDSQRNSMLVFCVLIPFIAGCMKHNYPMKLPPECF